MKKRKREMSLLGHVMRGGAVLKMAIELKVQGIRKEVSDGV